MTGILELPGSARCTHWFLDWSSTVVDSRVLSDEPLNGEVSGKLTIDTAELDVFLSWPSRSYEITPRRREPAWPLGPLLEAFGLAGTFVDDVAVSDMDLRRARSTSAPSMRPSRSRRRRQGRRMRNWFRGWS